MAIPLARVDSRDVLTYEMQSSLGMAAISQDGRPALANANSTNLGRLSPSVTSDQPANANALETRLAVNSADVTAVPLVMGYFRAGVQVNRMEQTEGLGGGNVRASTNRALAQKLVNDVDAAFVTKVAANAFAAVAGAISEDAGMGVDNQISFGVAGTTYLPTAFGSAPVGATWADGLIAAIGFAYDLLAEKDAVPGGAATEAMVSRVMMLCPLGVASALNTVLAQKGVLGTTAEVGREAMAGRGILGRDDYMGEIHNVNVFGHKALGRPAGDDPWDCYVIPVGGGAVQGAVFEPDVSDTTWESGATDGAYVDRRWGVQRAGFAVAKPGHVVRLRVVSDTTV